MGTYVYGYTSKKKPATMLNAAGSNITVQEVKFICKPWYGGFFDRQEDRWEKDRHVAPMLRAADRTTDRSPFIVVQKTDGTSGFYEGSPVYDLRTREDMRLNNSMPATFYDDPFGFGNQIGTLIKIGKKWKVNVL